MNNETKIEIEKELETINTALQNIDYLYQEGVLFNTAEIKTLTLISEQLEGIVSDIRDYTDLK